MKKTNITSTVAHLLGTANDRSTLELWAEAVINSHRFASRQAEIAHRYGEASDRQVRFPSADSLSESGHDIVAVAFALDRGVTASAMKKALKGGISLAAVLSAIEGGMDTAAFSQAVKSGLVVRHFASLIEHTHGDDLNGALANFVESAAERRAEPNPIARLLARVDGFVMGGDFVDGGSHRQPRLPAGARIIVLPDVHIGQFACN